MARRGARYRGQTAWLATLLAIVAFVPAAACQDLAGRALIEALRRGGYIIYFRHAATDWRQDDRVEEAGDWASCDPGEMRQLSEVGRATARRIGKAIRALDIPIARVLSSEYCRAAETARLMEIGTVETTRDIMNMRAASHVGGTQAAIRRARRLLATPPPAGANTVVVGPGNLMRAATGSYVGEGGGAVFLPAPDSETRGRAVARLGPDDWRRLAGRFAGDR